MISKKALIKKLSESKDFFIPEEIISQFYDYINLSFILFKIGPSVISELYRIEKEKAWPLLNRMVTLDIDLCEHFSIDREISNKFTQLIVNEQKVRENKGTWVDFKKVFYGRIKLYPKIFKFNKKDFELCMTAAQEYREINLYAGSTSQ